MISDRFGEQLSGSLVDHDSYEPDKISQLVWNREPVQRTKSNSDHRDGNSNLVQLTYDVLITVDRMAGQTNWDDLVGEINRLDSMAFRLVWRGEKDKESEVIKKSIVFFDCEL